MALRVVLADDHRLMLEALHLTLTEAEGIEIVGFTNEGVKVLPLVARTRPDVVLLDFHMPDMDGLACLSRLRQHHPDVTVVMLSGSDEPGLISEALRRGASAFILKQIDPRDLPAAIRQAREGTVFGTLGRAEAEPSPAEAAGLTEKELRVLELLSRGLSTRDIARELWLSPQTVKFHLTNLYRKLGVANRTEAARYAFEHGLVARYDSTASS
jgi:DNA-binding NarL/FixJ family response regulator